MTCSRSTTRPHSNTTPSVLAPDHPRHAGANRRHRGGVAVAAELAIRELGLERVLILDWDAHHGNGTAEIFRRRDDVLLASIHRSGNFPGTGMLADMGSGQGLGYTINVPVPTGSDEQVWLSVLEHVLIPAGLEYRPQLVLISAGFDAHRSDPLGGCLLETASFAQMALPGARAGRPPRRPGRRRVRGRLRPVRLADCVVATVGALGGEGEVESIAPDRMLTSRVAAHVAHYCGL